MSIGDSYNNMNPYIIHNLYYVQSKILFSSYRIVGHRNCHWHHNYTFFDNSGHIDHDRILNRILLLKENGNYIVLQYFTI